VRLLSVLGAVVVLAVVNAAIYDKERTIANGERIYLELAPVDPRSLMQGDYMALRFTLAREIEEARQSGALPERARSAPIELDARRIAHLQLDGGGGLSVAFKIRHRAVWLGTNAYFFEEGSAERYANARFGEFRLNASSGEAVLVGLVDEALQPL